MLLAAGAAWLSGGVVSPVGAEAADRLAVLPPLWVGLAFLLGATALASLPMPAARLRPLYLSALLWLPWLPVPIPAAFLIWHGPLAWIVWAITAALLLAPLVRAWWSRLLAASPAKQLALAVVLGTIAYTAAAWRMASVLPGGDEPHYLVIAQSLLYDGDLKIENNHRRGDYHAYIAQELKPDYLRRGIDREIYSIHAPGLSALVLPAFAAAGYPGAVVFLSIISALGAAIVWRAGWRLTGDAAAAWAGWAAVAFSAPFFFQAFTVYPDGPAAAIVMTALYALAFPESLAASPWRTALHGAAVAALPWLHTRYAVLAAAIGVLLVLRLWQANTRSPVRSRAALAWWTRLCAAFLMIPAVSAAAWLWSFYAIYGEWNPAAPYGDYTQTSLGNAARGLTGLLVDQQFGVLPNAPVYVIALAGLGALWRRNRRLAIELLAVTVPYAVAVASYHMWWGGQSSPARFIVPALLPFGMPAAVAWSGGNPRVRSTFSVLLAASIVLTAALVWVDRGALVYNVRDGFARWMDAAAPLVNLPRAVPTLFRNSTGVTAWIVAAWATAAAASWRLLGYGADESQWAVRRWLALACTVMLGATLGWRIAGASPLESGTGLVRVAHAAAIRGTVISLPALRRDTVVEAFVGLRVPSALRRDRPADGLLFVGRELPAGRYRVIAEGQPTLAGTLEATVGRRTRRCCAPLWMPARRGRQRSSWTCPLAARCSRLPATTRPAGASMPSRCKSMRSQPSTQPPRTEWRAMASRWSGSWTKARLPSHRAGGCGAAPHRPCFSTWAPERRGIC